MSFTFYVDPIYQDFRVSNGQLVFARGSDVALQQIKIALGTELGEWYLNTVEGVPYYSSTAELNDNSTPGILGGKLSAAEISAIIRRIILSVPSVESISKLALTENVGTRRVSIEAVCQVVSGDINSIGTQTVESITVSM